MSYYELSAKEVARLGELPCFELRGPVERESYSSEQLFKVLALAPGYRALLVNMDKSEFAALLDGADGEFFGEPWDVQRHFEERFFGEGTFLMRWRLRTRVKFALLFRIPHNCRLQAAKTYNFGMVREADNSWSSELSAERRKVREGSGPRSAIVPLDALFGHEWTRAFRTIQAGTRPAEPVYPYVLLHALQEGSYTHYVANTQYHDSDDDSDDDSDCSDSEDDEEEKVETPEMSKDYLCSRERDPDFPDCRDVPVDRVRKGCYILTTDGTTPQRVMATFMPVPNIYELILVDARTGTKSGFSTYDGSTIKVLYCITEIWEVLESTDKKIVAKIGGSRKCTWLLDSRVANHPTLEKGFRTFMTVVTTLAGPLDNLVPVEFIESVKHVPE